MTKDFRDTRGNVYDLERVDRLPADWRGWCPSLEQRRALRVGDVARLCVYVNGGDYITPWLEIVEVVADGSYVGVVGGVPEWLAPGTRVPFTADNVIGYRDA